MSYPKQFLEEIRTRVPLSDVIGKRVRIQRAGREFKACCPFHKEKTPSFTINDQKGFYHCFGCGAHGDVINFVMEHDGMGFPDAVKFLAAQAGIEVPEQTPEQKQHYEKRDRAAELLEAAAKWFCDQLYRSENHRALSYMQDRGLSSAVLKRFRVGYAPPDGDKIAVALKEQGFSDAEMEKYGLIRKSAKHAGYYAFFRERIIFPVFDLRGRVVAFGGRIVPFSYGGPNPDTGNTPPKYLNSPDHDLFHKGQMLYGIAADVRKGLSGEQPLAIVEGYMDVIALAQHGYRAAVAPLGTALTETQIGEAWRLIAADGMKAPVLCFDGDEAGRRAAARAMERALPIIKPDHSVHFVFLPEGHDPDTLVQEKGRAAFEALVQKPVTLLDMLWEEEVKRRGLNTPESQAGLKNALLASARSIADRDIQNLFIRNIEKRFAELHYGAFSSGRGGKRQGGGSRKQWRKNGNFAKDSGAYRPSYMPLRQTPQVTQIRERILLVTLINYPGLFDEFGEIFGMLPAKTAEFDALRRDIIDILSAEPDTDSAALQNALDERGHGEALRSIYDGNIYLHAGFARPGQEDMEDVRAGWQDTLNFMRQTA
ncbi:MAG: DNA primase [Micavibrio sp.]|nr:MAG: DNA primase [Micavibrio sp.]